MRFARVMFTATAAASAALAGLLLSGVAGGAAQASGPGGPAAAVPTVVPASGPAPVTSSGTSKYQCFVTFPASPEFPKGSTTESYNLTYGASAPAAAKVDHPFAVTVDFPVITPRTDFNRQVASVRVVFQLPHGALPISAHIAAPARIGYGENVIIVSAAGPFKAGQPFRLPPLTVVFVAGKAGTYVFAQGGATLTDPAFSWIRTDPEGTDRPLACFLPDGTPLTRTVVTP